MINIFLLYLSASLPPISPAGKNNIPETIKALSDKHDIVPLIYLRRIKTDKWYYTCCSPEASYMIIESLKIRKDLKWDDKLFDYTDSLILTKFQEINDNNNCIVTEAENILLSLLWSPFPNS